METPRLTLKITFGDDTRRISVQTDLSYSDLIQHVTTLFRLSQDQVSAVVLKYLDDESDLVTVSSDQELREAVRDALLAKNLLRFTLFVKPPAPVPEGPTRTCPTWRRQMKHSLFRELGEKGIALMDQNQHAKACEVFMQQAEVARPWLISTPLYNIACCKALLGETDAALSWLSKSIDAGFRDAEHIKNDEDLVSLRDLPLFKELIAKTASKPAWNGRRCGGGQRPECRAQQPQQPAPEPEQPHSFAQVFEQVQPFIQHVVANLPEIQEQIMAQLPHLQQHFAAQFPHLQQQFAECFAQTQPTESEPAKPAEPAKVPEPVAEPVKVPEPVKIPEALKVPQPVRIPEPVPVPEVPAPEPAQVPEAAQGIPQHLPQSVKNNLIILQEMGFLDTKQNLKALLLARGDVSVAISKLLAGN